MDIIYVFEVIAVKYAKDKYVIYPPKEYQEKFRRLHGEKV